MNRMLVLAIVTIIASENQVMATSPQSIQNRSEMKSGAIFEKVSRVRRTVGGERKIKRSEKSKVSVLQTRAAEEVSVGKLSLQLFLGMLLIITLIIVSLRLLKKAQNSKLLKKMAPAKGLFEVLETCYLGKDQKIVAMRAGQENLVLGVSGQGIKLITTLKKNPPNDLRPSTLPKEKQVSIRAKKFTNPNKEFSESLNQFLTKFKKPKTVAQSLREI